MELSDQIKALETKCDLLSATVNQIDSLLAKALSQKLGLLEAARTAERLLDSVAFVAKPGDTVRPLELLREAIEEAKS